MLKRAFAAPQVSEPQHTESTLEFESLRKQVSDAHQDIQKLLTELYEIRSRDGERDEMSALRSQLADAHQEMQRLQKELIDGQPSLNEVELLRAQLAEANREVQELRNSSEDQINEFGIFKSSVQAKRTASRQEQTRAQEEIEALQSKLTGSLKNLTLRVISRWVNRAMSQAFWSWCTMVKELRKVLDCELNYLNCQCNESSTVEMLTDRARCKR